MQDFVHISLYNKMRTIDIINEYDEKWLNTMDYK